MEASVLGKSAVWTGKYAGVGGNFASKQVLHWDFSGKLSFAVARRPILQQTFVDFQIGHGSGSISVLWVAFYGRFCKVTCAWLIFSFVLWLRHTLCKYALIEAEIPNCSLRQSLVYLK